MGIRQNRLTKAFYISFYHPARLVRFVMLGEEEKDEKNCDSQSLSSGNCEVTAKLRCVVLAVKNTSTLSELTGQNTSECSISTVYHIIFVINWLYFVLSLSEKWDWISDMLVDYAHGGGNIVSPLQIKPNHPCLTATTLGLQSTVDQSPYKTQEAPACFWFIMSRTAVWP